MSEGSADPTALALRRVPPPPPIASSGGPPPLPRRHRASSEFKETGSALPPPLPTRPAHDPPPVASVAAKPSSRVSNGIAPPPTRAIGLNDKLPPPRRRSFGDSDDSDSEHAGNERTQPSMPRLNRALEDLPDSTHCSRRAPVLPNYIFARARIHVAAPACVAAAAGNHVAVAGHHHDLRVYDLSRGDSPVFTIDLKDLPIERRGKEPRITAMEFRMGEAGEEDGGFLWCGSKDGHVWEFDVQRGALVRVRSAHMHPVAHVLRHGRAMITLDDSGKASVWKDYHDLNAGGQPRIARTADKQGFVRIFSGLLWTSSGSGAGSGSSNGAAGGQRGPTIRVYDIFSLNCTAKLVTPPDLLGAVTSGAMLPSQPQLVYLGHEGGYISCWSLSPSATDGASPNGTPDLFDSGRPVPCCVQVVKISVSDVLSLEGVVDKLWMGSRKGTITAYDVETKPWTITNMWQAHGELPVLKIFADPFSIGKSQRLHVVSLGRDEQMRFWDGLLGTDWVEAEVQKREAEFSTFRDVNVLICSWNTDAQKPEALTGNTENVNFLENVLHSVDSPDIIVFGFQELIDLENRSLTAKTVLLGNQKKKTDGTISEKVSRSYRMWHERLVHAVRLAMPVDDPYVVAHTDSLVGLFSCIFVRQRQKHLLRDSAITAVKRGMGGRYGNKGAIVARFVIDDSSLCFINCHLAAGQSHTTARNQDLVAILEDGTALPPSGIDWALPYVGGGDGSMILDHEICFLGGDLNYRIDQRRDVVINAIESQELDFLLNHDQLRKQAKHHPGFRLRSFTEAPITFAPTYKYDRRTSDYDTSEKRRAPAWCDRILYRCRDPSRVRALHYRRYEANVSDHRPISAAFRVTVKSIHHEARAAVKSDVQTLWRERELGLLCSVQDFYTSHHIL
ncbi:DNase I-like protein [Gautieria morchelliformis]|nr:DNase I-like protein [Gautieria morchelliformis]